MSVLVDTFEVRVKVSGRKPIGYSSKFGTPIYKEEIKMFHITAKDSGKAREKAKKYGSPISVRKLNEYALLGNMENLDLSTTKDPYSVLGNPYPDAIAMDEMIWNKTKRKKRVDRKKIEKDIDNDE
jgi:hypothetical protein